MIADYEEEPDELLGAPRQYGLTQNHKHLKEMVKISGIKNAPVFCPVVGDFYSGMQVTVPLHKSQLSDGFGLEDVKNAYKELYKDAMVTYTDSMDESGFVSSNALSGFDNMQISVAGNEERILLLARYDNLGKGASGAAVECMNIALGIDKTTSLLIKDVK